MYYSLRMNEIVLGLALVSLSIGFDLRNVSDSYSSVSAFQSVPVITTTYISRRTQYAAEPNTKLNLNVKDDSKAGDKNKWEKSIRIINRGIATTLITATLTLGNGIYGGNYLKNIKHDLPLSSCPSFSCYTSEDQISKWPMTASMANAAVAPLADVGLREFLVKDGKTFLRLTLPTSLPTSTLPGNNNDEGKSIQEAIELVRLRLEQVGFSGKTAVWNSSLKDVNVAKALLEKQGIMKDIPQNKMGKATQLSNLAMEKLIELAKAVRDQDISQTLKLQEECSSLIYDIRSLSLPGDVLPYEIPTEFTTLPQLRGRATVECTISKSNVGNSRGKTFLYDDGTRTTEEKFTMVIDGYHAPITGGNFVDLVQRKFYDEMDIQSVEELFVQTGLPAVPGEETLSSKSKSSSAPVVEGFVNPKTMEIRTIPLELFYKNDKEPTYSYTSDDDMRATEAMSLPFQAYGALGMAHDPEDVNTASSQFFFLKWDQGLVAPGRNTLDGSSTCFGYVTSDNVGLISQVNKGDKIVSMKVVQGIENLFVDGRHKV